MIKHRVRAVLMAVVVVIGGLMTAVPVHAQPMYEGKVIAESGLSVRHLPTTESRRKGSLERGQTIEIVCKVRGTSVDDNNWYALPRR